MEEREHNQFTCKENTRHHAALLLSTCSGRGIEGKEGGIGGRPVYEGAGENIQNAFLKILTKTACAHARTPWIL